MATEIRIEDAAVGRNFSCEYEGCGATARQWSLPCGDIVFHICERHGQPIISMLKRGNFEFTGGYDDEPKSKLAQAVNCLGSLQFSGNELVLAQCIELIGEHLIEKEKQDD